MFWGRIWGRAWGAPAVVAPENVLSCDGGDGSMDVSWTAPGGGCDIDYYEPAIATSVDGPWDVVARSRTYDGRTRCRIVNLPFGTTVYTKVRAVDFGGNAGPYSDIARDAVADKATTVLRFTGMIGDTIDMATMFAAEVEGYLVAVRTTGSGVIGG